MSGPAKGSVFRKTSENRTEPYVGMPIYLDDSFFDFMGENGMVECPAPKESDDEMNEAAPMPAPETGGGQTPPQVSPAPGQRPSQPAPTPTPTPAPGQRPDCSNGGNWDNGCNGGDRGNGDNGGNWNNGGTRPMDCVSGCPLAMAYVPWQQWTTTYDMEEGFSAGTIFPELDLPFLGGACK